MIPVPEAESNTAYYDRLYRGEVKVPKQLIHIQRESPSHVLREPLPRSVPCRCFHADLVRFSALAHGPTLALLYPVPGATPPSKGVTRCPTRSFRM